MRRIAAGFLAGASGVLGLLAVLALLLVGSGVFTVMRETAFRRESGQDAPFLPALGGAVAGAVGSFPAYVWSFRWAILALGLLGMAFAFADGLQDRLAARWRGRLDLVIALWCLTAAAVGWLYADRERLLLWIAETPEVLAESSALLLSDVTLLTVAVLLALGAAYVVVVTWNGWYDRWAGLLGVDRRRPAPAVATGRATPAPAPRSTYDEWRASQRRLAELRRGGEEGPPAAAPAPAASPIAPDPRTGSRRRRWAAPLAVGVLAALLLVASREAYAVVGSGMRSGGVWATPDAPATQVELRLHGAPRRLAVHNIGGAGRVEVALVAPSGGVVRRFEGFRLSGSAARFASVGADLQGLPPGAYRLVVRLREGGGGLVSYAAVFGGGWPALAATVGIAAATATLAALALVALLSLLAGRGVPRASGADV